MIHGELFMSLCVHHKNIKNNWFVKLTGVVVPCLRRRTAGCAPTTGGSHSSASLGKVYPRVLERRAYLLVNL